MAFKQTGNAGQKSNNKLVKVVAIIVVIGLVGFIGMNMLGSRNDEGSNGSDNQEQTQENTENNEAKLTSEQESVKMASNSDLVTFQELLDSTKWVDSQTGSICTFDSEHNLFKEELSKNNSSSKVVFVVCQLKANTTQDKTVTTDGIKSEISYNATCMDDTNNFFNMTLVVNKVSDTQSEKVQSLVLTCEKFSLGSYYTKASVTDSFAVSGLNEEKLKWFGLEKRQLIEDLKNYCNEHLPTVNKIDFSISKITTFMDKNYVVMTATTNSTSKNGKTLYVSYDVDSKQLTVSETQPTT